MGGERERMYEEDRSKDERVTRTRFRGRVTAGEHNAQNNQL